MSTGPLRTYTNFTTGISSAGISSAGIDPTETAPKEAQRKVSVIQCPSCQTKFAVETSAITAIANPRFHCSRCDQVFSMQANTFDSSSNATIKHDNDDFIPNENDAVEFNPIESNTGETKQTTIDFLSNATNLSFDDNSVFGTDESGEDFSVSVMEDKIGDQLFDFGITGDNFASNNIAKNFAEEEPMGYGSLSRSDSKLDYFSSSQEPDLQVIDPLLNKKRPRAEANYKLLLLPSVAATILFGMIAITSMVSPKTVQNLSDNFIASKAEKLPADLFIQKAIVKRVVLDSGESVSVINGNIKNNSTLTITDLFVEGAIFDPRSELLGRKKAHVMSALNKSRLQSLTPQMVDDLQNAKPIRSLNLRPGESAEFSVVVPEPQSASALPPTSFTVRFHSGKVKI